MSHIKKLIRGFDQFGVLSQITYFNNDEKFQTLYGGILSLIIYFLGISYFLHMLYLWQTYQIPPFYLSQMSSNLDIKFNLTQPLFVFGLVIGNLKNVTTNDRMMNISKNGAYYNYGLWNEQQEKMRPNDPGYPCVITENESYLFDPVCVNLQDQSITKYKLVQTSLETNFNNPIQTNNIVYSMYKCVSVNDINSKKCLDDNDQLDLINNTWWKLTLFSQDVDIQTGKIKNIEQVYYYQNEQNNQTLVLNLNVNKATFYIDGGVIFPNEQVVEVVRSVEIVKQNQGTQMDQIEFQSYIYPELVEINFHLNSNEEIIRITYPRLGTIISQAFSIFQLLLLSGYFMNMLNKRMMNYNMEQALLQVYFPSFKFFKFEFDWKGGIKSIFFRDKILQNKDFEIVKQFRDDRANQLRGKLDSINIVHEISRIQMHLQSKIPIQEYNKIQGLGYKMNLPQNLTEKFLLDDSIHFIDYYDLSAENEKYKIYQPVEILESSPINRITEVTKREKQLIQVHSFIEDRVFVQPQDVILIVDHHQTDLPPNRTVTQIQAVSQKLQVIPIHNDSKDQIQDHNAPNF